MQETVIVLKRNVVSTIMRGSISSNSSLLWTLRRRLSFASFFFHNDTYRLRVCLRFAVLSFRPNGGETFSLDLLSFVFFGGTLDYKDLLAAQRVYDT